MHCDVGVGRKEGTYSQRAGTVTFNLRCKWANCYGCPNQKRIVCGLETKEVDLQEAQLWPHKHDGKYLPTRGLPPNIKAALESLKGERGRILH